MFPFVFLCPWLYNCSQSFSVKSFFLFFFSFLFLFFPLESLSSACHLSLTLYVLSHIKVYINATTSTCIATLNALQVIMYVRDNGPTCQRDKKQQQHIRWADEDTCSHLPPKGKEQHERVDATSCFGFFCLLHLLLEIVSFVYPK